MSCDCQSPNDCKYKLVRKAGGTDASNNHMFAMCRGDLGESARRGLLSLTEKQPLVMPAKRKSAKAAIPGVPVNTGAAMPAIKIGTMFEERAAKYLKYIPGMKRGCQICKNLKEQMDRQGPKWCRDNKPSLLSQIVSNASQAHEYIPAALMKLGTGTEGFRAKVDETLEAVLAEARAIEDQHKEEQRQKAKIAARSPRQNRPRRKNMWAVNPDASFVSSAQLQNDVKELVGKLPADITAIAGVARSGLAVATMVSMYLHLPMLTIRQTIGDVQQTGNGWRLGGSKHVNPQKQKVAVIDDTVMTGNSLTAIRPVLEREFGDYVTATVYCNPSAARKPDIWVRDLPSPHLLEWNLFNSVFSPNLALDFDGILCHDCPPGSDDDGSKYLEFIRTAKPLYVPKKCAVPLIITARIEKYRSETQQWLDRHRIKVRQLIMHPASNLRERQRDDIAAWKANHFVNWCRRHRRSGPPPVMFAESDDRQAQGIAKVVNQQGLKQTLVVCPASAKVY